MSKMPSPKRDDITPNQPGGEMPVIIAPINLSKSEITGREEAGGEEGGSPPVDPYATAIDD